VGFACAPWPSLWPPSLGELELPSADFVKHIAQGGGGVLPPSTNHLAGMRRKLGTGPHPPKNTEVTEIVGVSDHPEAANSYGISVSSKQADSPLAPTYLPPTPSSPVLRPRPPLPPNTPATPQARRPSPQPGAWPWSTWPNRAVRRGRGGGRPPRSPAGPWAPASSSAAPHPPLEGSGCIAKLGFGSGLRSWSRAKTFMRRRHRLHHGMKTCTIEPAQAVISLSRIPAHSAAAGSASASARRRPAHVFAQQRPEHWSVG